MPPIDMTADCTVVWFVTGETASGGSPSIVIVTTMTVVFDI